MKNTIILIAALLGLGGPLLAQDSGGPMNETLRLASKSIRHAQVFEAKQIQIEAGTAIDEAVKVEFKACDKIVFGEGFHLAPGAEMVAQVEENCKESASESALEAESARLTLGPNPFSESLVLNVDLPAASSMTLQIYDLGGRLVAEPLSAARMEIGKSSIQLDLTDLPSGSYFYKAETEASQWTGKLIRID